MNTPIEAVDVEAVDVEAVDVEAVDVEAVDVEVLEPAPDSIEDLKEEEEDFSKPAQLWVGIDVSQGKLDVCVEEEPPPALPLLRSKLSYKDKKRGQSQAKSQAKVKARHKEFPNTQEGWTKLRGWVHQLSNAGRPGALVVHYCMEATGSYSTPLAVFLAEKGARVSVVNPRLIANHTKKRGQGNKTDKADAATIADFCRKENPPLWEVPAPELLQLQALVRRFEAVQDLVQQEKCRLAAPGQSPAVLESVRATLAFLEQEMARLRQQMRDHVNKDDQEGGLKRQFELLTSIAGIGEATAHLVLAELGDVTRFEDAEAVGAFAGLAPREHKSGTSIHKATTISRQGSWRLRKGLYLPTIVACRFNPVIKAFYQRLLKRGLKPKAAVVAAMRKLLMICFGVLKNQTAFRSDWTQLAA